VIEVGTAAVAVVAVAPAGNNRLLVRLMVSPWPVGTVITTGDQPPTVTLGFRGRQLAVELATTAPQV
jgi:hypothetical protein